MTRQEICKDRLRRLMTRHRVILRPGVGDPAAVSSPDSIASRVPFIWLDIAGGRCESGRRLLRLEDGGRHMVIRARTRAAPRESFDPEGARFATDRAGARLPVCVMDRESPTIYSLIDLATLWIADASDREDPIGLLIQLLFEKPIESLLRRDGPPLVGSAVRDRMDQFLRAPRALGERVLRQELSLLERFCRSQGPVVTRLTRRTEEIRKRLDRLTRSRPEDVSGTLERELELLCRLVQSRTCSELRFGAAEIGGTINPAPDGAPCGRSPLEFNLSLASEPSSPVLFLWMPPNGAERLQPRCLGEGLGILDELLESKSLYGVVDLVLNYVETNRVGERARRGRLPTLMETALGWPPGEVGSRARPPGAACE